MTFDEWWTGKGNVLMGRLLESQAREAWGARQAEVDALQNEAERLRMRAPAAIRSALLRVAGNVAKHCIQRGRWAPDDGCFQVDLRAAEAELLALLAPAPAAPAAEGGGR
jgi:hypothetical protein